MQTACRTNMVGKTFWMEQCNLCGSTTKNMDGKVAVDGIRKHAQRSDSEETTNSNGTVEKEEKEDHMDRQMERVLFRNDAETFEEDKGFRSVEEEDGELDHKSREANANKNTKVTFEGLRAILEQQQYRCALSGVVLSPDCASLDHIHPLSKGGRHVINNVQIVHPVVNSLKGEMTQVEFLNWINLIASNAAS